jgi:hypothetical protein
MEQVSDKIIDELTLQLKLLKAEFHQSLMRSDSFDILKELNIKIKEIQSKILSLPPRH